MPTGPGRERSGAIAALRRLACTGRMPPDSFAEVDDAADGVGSRRRKGRRRQSRWRGGRHGCGVALSLPETWDEYERARAEVDSLGRDAAGGEAAGPAEGGPDGTHPAPDANRWVATTREQRRAWDLPDLEGDGPVGPGLGDGSPARGPQEGRREDEIRTDAVEAV